MLKMSDSFTAEMLVKDIAASSSGIGSTSTGAADVMDVARRLGARAQLADGSGLCRGDRASARDVVRLLASVRARPYRRALIDSLPVVGIDGTLADRMRKTPAQSRCAAKTGTLSDVSALSGYCHDARGDTLVFSFVINGIPSRPATRLIDRMVQPIVCYGAPPGTAGLSSDRAAAGPRVIFGGGTRGRQIALTFDDGPSPYTPQVLAILHREHAPATFFQVGKAIVSGPDVHSQLDRERLDVGDHTQTHHDLSLMPSAEQYNEIAGPIEAIRRRGERFNGLFRPPYGSYNAATLKALAKLHLQMVLWTIDTLDYTHPGADRIRRRVLAATAPGGIVLMHDGGGDRSQTVAALPGIIDGLRARGFRLVSVPQLLRDDPPQTRPAVPFSACPAFTRDLGPRQGQLLGGAAPSDARPAARSRGMRWPWMMAPLVGLAALVAVARLSRTARRHNWIARRTA
jgi:peptidoglycan/xylan/chitin deacetylase (PgdA/CDA1 family)